MNFANQAHFRSTLNDSSKTSAFRNSNSSCCKQTPSPTSMLLLAPPCAFWCTGDWRQQGSPLPRQRLGQSRDALAADGLLDVVTCVFNCNVMDALSEYHAPGSVPQSHQDMAQQHDDKTQWPVQRQSRLCDTSHLFANTGRRLLLKSQTTKRWKSNKFTPVVSHKAPITLKAMEKWPLSTPCAKCSHTSTWRTNAEQNQIRPRDALPCGFCLWPRDAGGKTGAPIVFGPNAAPGFQVHSAKDGERLKLGNVEIEVLHTPGHTMESTTYLLRNEAGSFRAVFSETPCFWEMWGDLIWPKRATSPSRISPATSTTA